MDEKQKKIKSTDALRVPKAKKKFGLEIRDNVLLMPHGDFIKPLEVKELQELLPPPPTTSHHLPPPPTTQEAELPVSDNYPTSPSRDFSKVPNSVVRDAVPQGIFKGTSKQTYDALFLRTRASISPTRTIKAKLTDIQSWANVSHNTLRKHLHHLEAVGLIVRNWELGDNDGTIYEVRVPEEVDGKSHLPPPPPPTTSHHPPHPTSSLKVVGPSIQKVVGGGGGQPYENITGYADAKTLLKTKEEKDDDEPAAAEILEAEIRQANGTEETKSKSESGAENKAAFTELIKTLEATTKKLTGRGTTVADQERWKHVADILVTQLEIIASRTPISNAPAVLAEHLHRLLNSRRAQEQLGLITPAEAKEARQAKDTLKPKETIADLHLCPDCFGTNMWNPDGKGRRGGCTHPELEKARQRARENGDL